MTQTGGGCRATNYIGFIRRALEKAGMEQIPVVSINMGGIETNPGFKLDANLLTRAALRCNLRRYFHALCLSYAPLRKRARLRQRGSSEVDKKAAQNFLSTKKLPNYFTFRKMCREISRRL